MKKFFVSIFLLASMSGCYARQISNLDRYIKCMNKSEALGAPVDKADKVCKSKRGTKKVDKLYSKMENLVEEMRRELEKSEQEL